MNMKKIFITIAVLGLSFTLFDRGLYQIPCKKIDQQPINLAAFKNKKIVVAIVDAGKPNREQLLSLDSLYQQNASSLAVIVVPVNDFNGALPEQQLKNLLFDTLKLSYPVTEIGRAQKKQGANQYPLLQWLTHRLQNGHFDQDIEEAGQLYVINESGVLYATLRRFGLPNGNVVKNIIAKQVSINE
jgi:glutathione peroxidase